MGPWLGAINCGTRTGGNCSCSGDREARDFSSQRLSTSASSIASISTRTTSSVLASEFAKCSPISDFELGWITELVSAAMLISTVLQSAAKKIVPASRKVETLEPQASEMRSSLLESSDAIGAINTVTVERSCGAKLYRARLKRA